VEVPVTVTVELLAVNVPPAMETLPLQVSDPPPENVYAPDVMLNPTQLKVPVPWVMVAAALLMVTLLPPVAPSSMPMPTSRVAARAELMVRSTPSVRV
jgi:hypothetical protein